MNSFILNLQMEQAKTRKTKQEIEIKIKRCFCELSSFCNPYYKSAKDIKAEEIEQIGDELLALKNELAKTEEKIYELKEQLGEDNG